MRNRYEPFDENAAAHNDDPPLALGDSHRFGDPRSTGAQSRAAHDARIERELDDAAWAEDTRKKREQAQRDLDELSGPDPGDAFER